MCSPTFHGVPLLIISVRVLAGPDGYERSGWSRKAARICKRRHKCLEGWSCMEAMTGVHAERVQKYTVQSNGIWDRIRRAFAIDPERSTGVPLNPQYRNPPPGANPPEAYDDPVTVPAGDIAENPYYKRDVRRSYPRLSVVKQVDVVRLLSVGSKAHPKEDVLQIGEAGSKQLVEVKKAGEEGGLSAYFEKQKNATASIFGPTGLPPFPSGMSNASPEGGRKYVMDIDRNEGFPEECVSNAKAVKIPWLTCNSTDILVGHLFSFERSASSESKFTFTRKQAFMLYYFLL